MRAFLRYALLAVLFLGFRPVLFALEPWQAALARMPLKTNVVHLNRTNCIPLLLGSFQRNDASKGIIFMPGATDEFYFFRRAEAWVTNTSPSLWDAIVALTNQTFIRVSYRQPFVLVHTAEDPLEPSFKVEDKATEERIRKKKFPKYVMYNDRDWDFLLPILTFNMDTRFLPGANSYESNHFYRHSFAGWDLTTWEVLEAVSMAGKTVFTVQKRKVLFEGDKRFRARPPVPTFPSD